MSSTSTDKADAPEDRSLDPLLVEDVDEQGCALASPTREGGSARQGNGPLDVPTRPAAAANRLFALARLGVVETPDAICTDVDARSRALAAAIQEDPADPDEP